jgi:hypothetical protein
VQGVLHGRYRFSRFVMLVVRSRLRLAESSKASNTKIRLRKFERERGNDI